MAWQPSGAGPPSKLSGDVKAADLDLVREREFSHRAEFARQHGLLFARQLHGPF